MLLCRHILPHRRFSDPQTVRKTLTLLISEVLAEFAVVKGQRSNKDREKVPAWTNKKVQMLLIATAGLLFQMGDFATEGFLLQSPTASAPECIDLLASGTIQSANLNKRWSKRKSWCRKNEFTNWNVTAGTKKRERRRKNVAMARSGKVRTDEDPSGMMFGTGSWPSCTSASRRLRVEQLGRQPFLSLSCLRMLHWSYLLICSLFCQPWNNKETAVVLLVSSSWEDL